MATPLIPIRSVTAADIREIVDEVLAGAPTATLGRFLASVDWSRPEQSDPAIRALLGKLEGLETEYAEDDLSSEEFFSLLREAVGPAAARTG